MELTQAETESIRQWVAEGKSLSAIQKALESEYQRLLTYMEVRFLVDDLDLKLKGSKKKKPKEDKNQQTQASDALISGKVSITQDKVVRPGAVMSGTLTFSNGEKADWLIDAIGQPKLISRNKDYRPSREDMGEFQEELTRLIKSQGF